MSLLPLPFYGVYGASKSAFLDLTLSLRYELLNKEISVCAVIPNLTATDFIKHRIEVLSQDEYFSNKVSYIRELNKKSSKKADKPLKVVKVLVKVILKKSPQAVFYVGIKGYISALLAKILPQRLLYFFLTKIFKLQFMGLLRTLRSIYFVLYFRSVLKSNKNFRLFANLIKTA